MKTFSLFVLLLSLSLSFNLQARPGDLDATFGVSGVQVYDFGTLGWFTTPTHVDMDYFQKIRLNQDGKLLLSTNSYSSGYLLKINSDGSVDTGFSTEGLIRTPITGFDLNADGKILYSAVSYELPSDRISSHSIIATPQDGNSQTQVGSINAGEKLSAIQQDGKIIVSGADGRSGLWTLKRLLPTGELDETFGVHGIVELSMRAAFYMIPYIVKIDSDGKILIAGGIEWSHSGAYTRDFIIFRINTDGSRDTSFGPEGMKIIWFDDMVPRAEAAIHSVAIQADGKIVVAGGVLGAAYLATADPGPTAGRSSLYIARLNHDGTLDTGFNLSGKLAIPSLDGTLSQYASISGIAIQKDGKIVYTGSQGASNRNSEVGRLNSNGSFDTSFGNLGNGRVMLSDIGTTNYSTQSKDTLLIDNNCSIVIAGDTFNPVQQFSSKNTYDSFNQNVFVARILSGLEGYKCKGYRLTIPTDFHYNW